MAHTDRPNELAQTRLDYWTELVSDMGRRHSPVMFNKPKPDSQRELHQLWGKARNLDSGDFILVALAAIKPEVHIGVGVEISGSNYKEYYAALEKDKSRIENGIGYDGGNKQKFEWIPDRGTKVSDIWLYWYVDFFKRQHWPDQHKWLCDKLEAFRKVLAPRIEELTR